MIRFGMAIMEMVEQLTKGFVKATGRQPDNLEKLKIQQEAVQRFKDMNKVVDMEGNVIDTSKGIMGGRQIQENKELSQAIKEELMKKDNPYSDLVNTPRPKTIKEREAEVLADMEKNNKEAAQRIRDRKADEKQFNKDVEEAGGMEEFLNKNPIDDDTGDFAQGGRVGLMAGSVPKIFTLLKNPKKVKQAIDNIFPTGDVKYDATMAAESLVELNPKIFGNKLYDDLDSITRLDIYDAVISPMMSAQAKALRMKKATKPEKTLQSMKEGKGINMSDPEIAKEFEQFMKQTDPEGVKKLEQTFELDNFDPKGRKKNATGGRIGYKDGPDIKLYPRASGRETEQEVGPGIKISERDLNYGITGLLQGDKFFGGAEIDKGKVKIDVLSPEGDTLFKDTIGKKDAVNFILGMGDPKGEKFQIKTDKDLENMQFILKKSFAEGGRAGFKLGSIDKARRAFLKAAAGVGGGIAAFKTGLLSIGKGADAVKNLPPIKTPVTKLTDSTTQMPDWFPSFINKFRDEGKAKDVFKTKKVEVSKEEFDQAFKEGKGENYYTDVARTPEYKANNPDHMDYFKRVDTDERIYTTYTNEKIPGVQVDDMDGNVDVMFENDYSQPVSMNYTAPGKRGPETGRADVFVQGEAKMQTKPKGEFVANDVEVYATDPDGGSESVDVIADTVDDMLEGKTRQMEEYVTGKKTKLSRGEERVGEAEFRAELAAEEAAEAADEFASGGIARMLGE